MKWLVGALMFLLIVPSIHAALIEGDVYNFDLTPAQDVVVEIDTAPHQKVVVRNESYSIEVPAGNYVLDATQRRDGMVVASVQENITVTQEGTYTLDLILFPIIRTPDEIVPDINLSDATTTLEASGKPAPIWPYLTAVVVVLCVVAAFIILRRKKAVVETTAPSTTEIDDVVSAIKKHGGRTTQKELRKLLPYSEAKVSLMLTELEHKGVITKIKRGRANVIILK